MKQGIVLFCTLSITLCAFAYRPMLTEGNKWNVVNFNADANPAQAMVSTHVQKIEGDSLVEGVKYKKLLYSTDQGVAKWTVEALLREEGEKVWAMVDGKEYLMYDFSAKKGDILLLHRSIRDIQNKQEAVRYEVISIDSIQDKTGERVAKYTLKEETATHGIVIYERYGSDCGWMRRDGDEIAGGGGDKLLCAYDAKGQVVFRLELPWEEVDVEDGECSVWTSIPLKVSDTRLTHDNIFYHSATQTIQFPIDGQKHIMVTDSQGRVVCDQTTTTDAMHFVAQSGLYIVTVSTEHQTHIGKILLP